MAGSRISADDDEGGRSAPTDLFPWRKDLASFCADFEPQLPLNNDDFDAILNEYLSIDLRKVKDPFEINYAQLIQITILSADRTSFLVTGELLVLCSKLLVQQINSLSKTCKRFADELSRLVPEKKKSNSKEAEDLNRGEVRVEEPGCSQDSGYGSQQLPKRNEKSSLAKTIQKFIADEKQIGLFGDSTTLGSAIISQRRNLFLMFNRIASGAPSEVDLSPYYEGFFKLVKDHAPSSSANTDDESPSIGEDEFNQDASALFDRLRRHCSNINQAPGIPFSLRDLNEETQATGDETGYDSLLDGQEDCSENRLEISENVQPHLASNTETVPPENIDSLAEVLLPLLNENDNNQAKKGKGIRSGLRKRRLHPLQQLNPPEMLRADDLEPAMKRATLSDSLESLTIIPDGAQIGAMLDDSGYGTSPFSEAGIDGELTLDLSQVSLDGDFRAPSPLFDSSTSLLDASKCRTSSRVDMKKLIQRLNNTLEIMEKNECTDKIPLTTLLHRSKINIVGVRDDNSTQGTSLGVAVLGTFHLVTSRKWYLDTIPNTNDDFMLTKTTPKDQQPPPGHVSNLSMTDKPGQL